MPTTPTTRPPVYHPDLLHRPVVLSPAGPVLITPIVGPSAHRHPPNSLERDPRLGPPCVHPPCSLRPSLPSLCASALRAQGAAEAARRVAELEARLAQREEALEERDDDADELVRRGSCSNPKPRGCMPAPAPPRIESGCVCAGTQAALRHELELSQSHGRRLEKQLRTVREQLDRHESKVSARPRAAARPRRHRRQHRRHRCRHRPPGPSPRPPP